MGLLSLVLLFILVIDEVDKLVLLGISIIDSPSLQVVDSDDPSVANLGILAREEDVALALFFALSVDPHGDADHEGGPLIAVLLRLDHVVDERKLYLAHILVNFEFSLIVVEPFEAVLVE